MTQRHGAAGLDPWEGHASAAKPIPPLDILAMLRVLWNGKLLIMGTITLVVFVAGYYAFRIAPPQYAATAILQLDATANQSGQLEQGQSASVTDEVALNTMVASVTSGTVLTNVIGDLNLLQDAEFNRYLQPPRPFALTQVRTRLRHLFAGTTEETIDDAAILEKTIQNLRSALSVDRQPDTYILLITVRSGNAEKAGQLADTTARHFLAHVVSTQEQTRANEEQWLVTRVDELRTLLDAQEMDAAALIATAQIQDRNVLDQLGAEVRATEQQIGEVRNALALLETAPDSGTARNRAEATQLRAKLTEISALKERLSTQLTSQSAGLAHLHQIQLQVDATRLVYQTVLGRLQENRMQGLKGSSADRIAPAGDGAYIGPPKILILIIAAMLGATLGVIIVIAQHNTRKGVIDAQELRQATGLPVFAQFTNKALKHLHKGNSLRMTPNTSLLQASRELHTALSLTLRDQPSQVILSTSSIHGEGKTSQAIALAYTLGHAGKSVVLLCADASTPELDLGENVLVTSPDGLRNGAFLGEHLSAFLNELRKDHDHIIIDGPPVLLASQAQMIACYSDAIIYAVRWAKTPLDVIQRGLQAFDDIGHTVTGLVLSNVDMRKLRRLSADPCVDAIQTAQA